jgi:hypothetical protein
LGATIIGVPSHDVAVAVLDLDALRQGFM